MAARKVSFLAFFLIWAKFQGWKVPMLHVRMCHWMEHCTAPERVLMIFRGAAKSTIYAVFKAWKLHTDPTWRSLVWSADGPTAEMLTADVINVLRNHPLTAPLLGGRKPGKKRFWVNGAKDARNASMRAVGVDSNATGARADDVDFDDVEVPGNIETPEARAKLRYRISDSTHILVPGGQATYIGTPHTTDSIYPEVIAGGAAVLKIPLFEHSKRFAPKPDQVEFPITFAPGPDGLYVMTGIHTGARMCVEGVDYVLRGSAVVFAKPPNAVLDVCTGCAWPERFDRKEIALRRKKTRTLNAWDSQYMLEAKPLGEIRLDPERLSLYDVEPRMKRSNGELLMLLGNARIVAASVRWDPASGKVNSDVSAVSVVLQDEEGRRYAHRVMRLLGDIAEFAADDKTIIGGQVFQLAQLVKAFRLPRVTVETNGAGLFAPKILQACLKQQGLKGVGVKDEPSVANKNKRILETLEPLLLTDGQLWVHQSVYDGPLTGQMKEWNPAVKNQADDYLDALAGAVGETPERIHARAGTVPGSDTAAEISAPRGSDDWRPNAGVHEVVLFD